MIRIAICDDEKAFLDDLSRKVSVYLAKTGLHFQVACFESAASLLQSKTMYEIYLLDIQMPGLDGMELAAMLRAAEHRSALIFITALKDYAVDAFRVEATDYLCKPVPDERLHTALNRAMRRVQAPDGKRLAIRSAGWCRQVALGEIEYCEVINRKVYLHLAEGVIDYYCRMDELAGQLDERFFRCHRSYLINLDHLVNHSDGLATLESGARVPVSRLRHHDLMDAVLRRMKKEAT